MYMYMYIYVQQLRNWKGLHQTGNIYSGYRRGKASRHIGDSVEGNPQTPRYLNSVIEEGFQGHLLAKNQQSLRAISPVCIAYIRIGDYPQNWGYFSCQYMEKLVYIYTSKVWRNLTILSQGASECLFLSSSDIKQYFEGKLDLVQQVFVMQIFEFTKSLSLTSNLKNCQLILT